MSFKPAFPFSLGDGKIFAVRPLIPFHFSKPVFNSTSSSFDDESSFLGDITTDIFYGKTYKSGWVFGGGAVTVLPTATNSKIAGKSFNAGPEVLVAKLADWGALGLLTTHQWDVDGWNDNDVSLSTMQYIFSFLLGDGWSVVASPTISYNWEADNGNEWSVPLGTGISKTSIIGGRPWKFALQVHYYVEQPDAFGPEWFVKFKISPVVLNPFSGLFKKNAG